MPLRNGGARHIRLLSPGKENKLKMISDKKLIIEVVDDDEISKHLEELDKMKLIAEVNSLELKYTVVNIEKYAKYLNEVLAFPFIAYYIIDNGMFGNERVRVAIKHMIENQSRQGVKCVCEGQGNTTRIIKLHLIEVEEKDATMKHKDIINLYKKWYLKNHKNK